MAKKDKFDNKLVMGILIGAAVVLLADKAINLKGDNKTSTDTKSATVTTQPQPTKPATGTININSAPILGDKSKVKVAVVEFSDFECPYCKNFAVQTFNQIVKDYVDTGKIIVSYFNFPLPFHDPMATKEATAAKCVKEQSGDKGFYEMAKLLYENSGGNGTGMTDDKMNDLAKQTGADVEKFKTCVGSNKFADEIKNEMNAASKIGVEGTPAFLVGKLDSSGQVTGDLFAGALPYASFKTAIDKQLAK
jgi:protein-disulfide isomerase